MDEIGTQSIMLLLGLKLRAVDFDLMGTLSLSPPVSLCYRLRNLCKGNSTVVS